MWQYICIWVWQCARGCGMQYACGCGSMHVGVALTVGSETQPQYVQPPVIPGRVSYRPRWGAGGGEGNPTPLGNFPPFTI